MGLELVAGWGRIVDKQDVCETCEEFWGINWQVPGFAFVAYSYQMQISRTFDGDKLIENQPTNFIPNSELY